MAKIYSYTDYPMKNIGILIPLNELVSTTILVRSSSKYFIKRALMLFYWAISALKLKVQVSGYSNNNATFYFSYFSKSLYSEHPSTPVGNTLSSSSKL